MYTYERYIWTSMGDMKYHFCSECGLFILTAQAIQITGAGVSWAPIIISSGRNNTQYLNMTGKNPKSCDGSLQFDLFPGIVSL